MCALGEKLQCRSFEEPKTNPHPLLTWQVSTPTFTPAAAAGLAKAKIAATAATPPAACNFLVIRETPPSLLRQRLCVLTDRARLLGNGGCFRTP
jgi:hypothetical protein